VTAGERYANLPTKDLLEKLLGVRQTGRLYRGSLQALFAAADGEVGQPADKLIAAREIVRRLMAEELKAGSALTSPGAVRDYLKLLLRDLQHEVFVCLWLDAQHRVMETQEAFRGTLTATAVYPREIVKAALAANAAAVIFAHNHPSGVAQPSQADELLTRNLREALSLVEVKVLDHFIVAGNQAISFAERGLL
jgi:DNA repair protein RadC